MTQFTCPACGGHHFGRDTATGHVEGGYHIDALTGNGQETRPMTILDTVRCHTAGCQWRGVWRPDRTPEQVAANAPKTIHALTGLAAVDLLSQIRAILWRVPSDCGNRDAFDPDKDRTLETLDAIAGTLADADLAPLDFAEYEDIRLLPMTSQTLAERRAPTQGLSPEELALCAALLRSREATRDSDIAGGANEAALALWMREAHTAGCLAAKIEDAIAHPDTHWEQDRARCPKWVKRDGIQDCTLPEGHDGLHSFDRDPATLSAERSAK